MGNLPVRAEKRRPGDFFGFTLKKNSIKGVLRGIGLWCIINKKRILSKRA